MKVSDVMTRNVRIANANETIQDAARIMGRDRRRSRAGRPGG